MRRQPSSVVANSTLAGTRSPSLCVSSSLSSLLSTLRQVGKHHGDHRAGSDPPGLEVYQVSIIDVTYHRSLTLIRIALDKTVGVVREKLPQVARATETQTEPAYVRVTRQPLSRLAQIRQSQSRWHNTKQAINQSIRNFSTSRATARVSYPSSRTATAVAGQTARAPFASQLRPNLTGGTLCRSAGGYGLGGGRAGARYFSHSPAAPAQVVNNVSQAVRAFWLSGSKARFEGFNPRTGDKRYCAVSEIQDEARQKMDMSSAQAKGSFIDFKVSPTITAVGPLATIPRSFAASACEEDDASLNNMTLMSNLAVDFARALKDLSAIMNDLKHLATLGDLPVLLENSTTLRVRFPGCDRDTVENLCKELNIRRGIVGQDEGFDQKTGTEMALLFPFAPSKTPSQVQYDMEIRARPPKRPKRDHVDWHEMVSPSVTNSPGYSHRSATSNDLEFEEIAENHLLSPLSGYSSLHASETGDDNVAAYFEPTHKNAHVSTQATGYEGLEGIYRFIGECDRARR